MPVRRHEYSGRAIAQSAAREEQVARVAIVGHGLAGRIHLGSSTQDTTAIASHADALSLIGKSIAAGGSISIYGRHVGHGDEGHAFLDQLSCATGVPVAASTTAVGNTSEGSLDARPKDGIHRPRESIPRR